MYNNAMALLELMDEVSELGTTSDKVFYTPKVGYHITIGGETVDGAHVDNDGVVTIYKTTRVLWTSDLGDVEVYKYSGDLLDLMQCD